MDFGFRFGRGVAMGEFCETLFWGRDFLFCVCFVPIVVVCAVPVLSVAVGVLMFMGWDDRTATGDSVLLRPNDLTSLDLFCRPVKALSLI